MSVGRIERFVTEVDRTSLSMSRTAARSPPPAREILTPSISSNMRPSPLMRQLDVSRDDSCPARFNPGVYRPILLTERIREPSIQRTATESIQTKQVDIYRPSRDFTANLITIESRREPGVRSSRYELGTVTLPLIARPEIDSYRVTDGQRSSRISTDAAKDLRGSQQLLVEKQLVFQPQLATVPLPAVAQPVVQQPQMPSVKGISFAQRPSHSQTSVGLQSHYQLPGQQQPQQQPSVVSFDPKLSDTKSTQAPQPTRPAFAPSLNSVDASKLL